MSLCALLFVFWLCIINKFQFKYVEIKEYEINLTLILPLVIMLVLLEYLCIYF